MPDLKRTFSEHPFGFLGGALGFIWAFLALRLGFLAALFLLALTVFGIWIGRQFDREDGTDLQELFDRILNRQERE